MWPPDFQYQEPHWQGCIVSKTRGTDRQTSCLIPIGRLLLTIVSPKTQTWNEFFLIKQTYDKQYKRSMLENDSKSHL